MNDQPVKKQSFLHGAAVLAAATLVVKVIGMFYKIPLQNIVGNAGYGYFTTAYDIYSVLLMISTTGLPVAMSRMISEAQTLGHTAQIQKIFRTSLYAFLTLGLGGTLLMLLGAKWLAADVMNSPGSWIAILCLSPAVLFICIISAFRGFFQGQSNMTPTSVSQVFEALCKLVIGLALAYVFTRVFSDIPLGAGGAILGVTTGCVVAMLFLWAKYRRATKGEAFTQGPVESGKKTLKDLLTIAIPITLGAAGLQIINLVDASLNMHRLLDGLHYTQDAADNLKGIYNFCQTIFNLPCAFITPITISVIPAITEHLTRKNHRGAKTVEDSALRMMALISLPCAVGLAVLSGPILQLLCGYEGQDLQVGAGILAVLGITVVFNSLVLTTNAIMQAHGDVKTPVKNMLIGGAVKVAVNYWLVGVADVNILGAAIGTLCCYATITLLNLIAMRRLATGGKLSFMKVLFRPLAAAACMGLVAFFSNRLLLGIVPSAKLVCLVSVAMGGLTYLVLVAVFKAITYDDCILLPKGEKIAKILRIR